MPNTNEKIQAIKQRLTVPAIAAPMFLVSGPDLVIGACEAGVIGAFPTLNARPIEALREWLEHITSTVKSRSAPWAANLIVHQSNKRFDADFALIQEFQPEIVITALGSPERAIAGVNNYGGLVFSDVNSVEFARKASDRGADGLVLVCEGAGGHTGFTPAAEFIAEVREFFDGPIAAGGAISTGQQIADTIAAGADFAYIGTRFIATDESLASAGYKQMIVDSSADDIVLTPHFTGVPAHFLKPSVINAGIDPELLTQPKSKIDFGELESHGSAWKDIWSAGKGVTDINSIEPVAELITRLTVEYQGANSSR
jgi:nitronate monooxygenase